MSHQVKAWKCDFCKYLNEERSRVNDHTKRRCYDNPDLRACKTCHHFGLEDVSDDLEAFRSYPVMAYWCRATDEGLENRVSNCNLWKQKEIKENE